MLLGVDFALGYPKGFALAARLPGRGRPWERAWRYLADAIEDSPNNANNRFDVARALNQRIAPAGPGPFWGCPPHQGGPDLAPTRPAGLPRDSACLNAPSGGGLPRRRLVEQRLPSAHEVWKLYTTGSVGSQTLLGIARLAQLRRHPALCDHLHLWPFETGFTPTPLPDETPGIVVAEVYPSLVNNQAASLLAARDDVTVRDQAQVLALAEHLARLDRADRIAHGFDRPAGLTDRDLRASVAEEGWVLGG